MLTSAAWPEMMELMRLSDGTYGRQQCASVFLSVPCSPRFPRQSAALAVQNSPPCEAGAAAGFCGNNSPKLWNGLVTPVGATVSGQVLPIAVFRNAATPKIPLMLLVFRCLSGFCSNRVFRLWPHFVAFLPRFLLKAGVQKCGHPENTPDFACVSMPFRFLVKSPFRLFCSFALAAAACFRISCVFLDFARTENT